MPQDSARRRNKMWTAVGAVALVILLSLAVTVRGFGQDLDQQQTTAAASREARLTYQAEVLFLLCSRDLVKTVRPEARPEVKDTCAGYSTLAESIATERAKQEAAAN